ncbi:uncharacterized protein FFB20_08533 [Fusarium fujikuroi]|uniref:Uncharacterized protein n=2 Tax=Fusarium fujikuroi TaxID=5127 RepID=S0EKG2_GIBF5|nr:uncharacterized protein FFUJ_11344 [Fusarium fujikuroi IMI 58289]KLP05584.1 uncharacterized protein Y057_10141 [Fusarium fujikuroi]KLP21696.1 uncharacterized protein LW94_15157 [Fusarium fujikuroi]QGI70625.1 hypothetical protein CEK27_002954 [Fusarium fujikuroi]QGI87970.1 hypothetical protein CEK25_002926 [Fusarium fujikuroi]QGJ01515.1 hypothetical protein CEK26_002959 [Fusarium fujikuroi]
MPLCLLVPCSEPALFKRRPITYENNKEGTTPTTISTMCIVKSTPRTCVNCEAEDLALIDEDLCEAVKEGKACPGKKKIVLDKAWLCPACHANTARGTCYTEPYDYQPMIQQEVAKKETVSFADKVKKVFGKK